MKTMIRSAALLTCGLLLGVSLPAHGQTTNTVSPRVPEGYRLVEGDVLMPIITSGVKAVFPTASVMFWPDGVVPYTWDDNVTGSNREAILVAMAVWQGVANVHFRPYRIGDLFWIKIHNSDGNNFNDNNGSEH